MNSYPNHSIAFRILCLVQCAILSVYLNASAQSPTATDSNQVAEGSVASPTNRVLVVYYSQSGHTERMARAVRAGAASVVGTDAVLREVGGVTKEELQAAHGIVLGAPVFFANIPGEMKTLLDQWNWKWGVDFTDKAGGAFATGGGQAGGQGNVIVSLLLYMIHNRMVVAGPLYRNERTGSVWAESGASAITGPADEGISATELDGARKLGERVAELARKLRSAP